MHKKWKRSDIILNKFILTVLRYKHVFKTEFVSETKFRTPKGKSKYGVSWCRK